MKVIARVALAVPYVKHSDCPTYPMEKFPVKSSPKKVGDVVCGIGAPAKPNSLWHCDTDLVWPVYEVNGEALEPEGYNLFPYVCRHQIIAGD